MRKSVRRLLWIVLTLLVCFAAVALYLQRRSLAVPDWYRPSRLTEAEKREAAGRAVKKVESFTGQFADAATAQARNEPPAAPVEATFSEDELDSYFDIWLDQMQYREPIGRYLHDPVIRLIDGRVVVVGKVEKIDRIASAFARPVVGEDGQVRVVLDQVKLGNQAVPVSIVRSLAGEALERWERDLKTKLPELQTKAAFNANGSANAALQELSQLIALHKLAHGEEADLVLFLPVYEREVAPVRCEAMAVGEDKSLRLQVRPMTAVQRESFLKQLQATKLGDDVKQ